MAQFLFDKCQWIDADGKRCQTVTGGMYCPKHAKQIAASNLVLIRPEETLTVEVDEMGGSIRNPDFRLP